LRRLSLGGVVPGISPVAQFSRLLMPALPVVLVVVLGVLESFAAYAPPNKYV